MHINVCGRLSASPQFYCRDAFSVATVPLDGGPDQVPLRPHATASIAYLPTRASFGWVDRGLWRVQFPGKIQGRITLMNSRLMAAAVAVAVVFSATHAQAQQFIN